MSRRLGTCAWLAAALWWVFASLALAQTPSNDDALLDQAEALLAQGDHNAASALANVVVARHATPRAHGVLGLALSHGADHAAAESALQRALQTPADPWVARNKSRIYQQLAALSDTPAASPNPTTPASTPPTTTSPPPSPPTSRDVATEGATPSTEDASRIPQDWLQAFPTRGIESTLSGSDAWSDRMRVNVGIALGLRLTFGLIHTSFERDGVAMYPFHDRTHAQLHDENWSNFETGAEIVLGGTWILGVSQHVELAPRFDLIVSPGLAGMSGHILRNTDQSDICCIEDLYFDGADTWIIGPVLVPGVRVRPRAASPLYVGIAARLGYLHASANVRPESYRGPVAAQDITINTWLVGGELALGTGFGDDLLWDLSVRAQVDTGGFVSLLALERRVY